jgi:hypothetical protein
MKLKMNFFIFAFLACSTQSLAAEGDRTISKVVKLLQEMLEKSQKEGDEERTLYAKFKCYCDQSEAEKRASIESLTEQISVTESKIASIQGDSGELSSDTADLKAKMAANKQSQGDAKALRKKENTAFKEEEADLTEAIKDMKEAIEVLAAIGADQTNSKGAADTKKFMSGHKSLISLRSQVQDALNAASALMTTRQRQVTASFLQAPFTGTYTSQSAEILGILKQMRDTFSTNLETATATEKASKEAHGKFIKVKEEAFDSMKADYERKQKELGDNDGELSDKKTQLAEAEKQKASDEEFLDKLVPMCAEKAKGYEHRKLLRANEEAAIAEAISILNSDAAFESFGTVDATSKGKTKAAASFIQLRAVRRHESVDAHARRMVQKVLEKAAQDAKSARLAKVIAEVQAQNPFETVLGEIEKMLELIGEEAAADKKNLDWCKKERSENEDSLKARKKEITDLEASINKLTETIEDPKTGLKKQIADTEQSLVENKASQKKETAERTEENVAYQADVKNLVEAEEILGKAIKVLKVYYDDLATKLAAGNALVQEDPSAPEAWKGDGAYAGQKEKGGDVITMLEFILSETNKEHMTAHQDEEKSQADYEDSMTKLKKEEAAAEKSLVKLQKTLADKEQELLEAEEDLKSTTKDKEAIETYLLKIKPGCDFITSNFDVREENRETAKDIFGDSRCEI